MRTNRSRQNLSISGQQKVNQESCPIIITGKQKEKPNFRAVKMAVNHLLKYRSEMA
jgi:hypothetical protein